MVIDGTGAGTLDFAASHSKARSLIRNLASLGRPHNAGNYTKLKMVSGSCSRSIQAESVVAPNEESSAAKNE